MRRYSRVKLCFVSQRDQGIGHVDFELSSDQELGHQDSAIAVRSISDHGVTAEFHWFQFPVTINIVKVTANAMPFHTARGHLMNFKNVFKCIGYTARSQNVSGNFRGPLI